MAQAAARGLREIVFSDREEAEAHISGLADSISHVDFDDDGFYLTYAGGSLGQCSLHRGATSALSYEVSESDELHFVVMQSGATRFSEARRDGEAAPQRSALLLGPASRGRSEVVQDSTGISMITTRQAVRVYAERLVGQELGRTLDGIGTVSLDLLADPVAATLARNVAGVFHELQALGRSGLSSLALAHFDDLLLGLVCVTASPVVRDAVRDHQPNSGSKSVRQARDYIHAHAAEPISFSQLATRLGVGLRSLQIAFRRELGCSPRDYLIACRLEVARARLMAAGEGVTVTQIALECGFTDMAVFARKYRENFGERPSETLRRR
ncbi:MAG: helix-turn-helix domain-containing protein [Hyphomicrobiaceae bacterium]|nr:helix-turn-helix domain-containing protein [Hyphomicrobiaceae bacterium]